MNDATQTVVYVLVFAAGALWGFVMCAAWLLGTGRPNSED